MNPFDGTALPLELRLPDVAVSAESSRVFSRSWRCMSATSAESAARASAAAFLSIFGAAGAGVGAGVAAAASLPVDIARTPFTRGRSLKIVKTKKGGGAGVCVS